MYLKYIPDRGIFLSSVMCKSTNPEYARSFSISHPKLPAPKIRILQLRPPVLLDAMIELVVRFAVSIANTHQDVRAGLDFGSLSTTTYTQVSKLIGTPNTNA